jgi:hypothetical protein
MDINRFDAWTRRRFGRAAAGGLAALVAALPSIAVGPRARLPNAVGKSGAA